MTTWRSLREGEKERRGGEGGHWGQRIQDNSQEEIKDNSQEERQNHSQEASQDQPLNTRWPCWSPWPTCPSLTTAWPPSSAGLLTTLSWALCPSHILLKMGREADIVGEANVACSSFRLFFCHFREWEVWSEVLCWKLKGVFQFNQTSTNTDQAGSAKEASITK